MSEKLCVLFPGIGYHCDKPLLYYSAMLAASRGYETIKLKYSGFVEGGDAAAHALKLSEEQLENIDFSAYSDIIFIGKSIGTAACLAYREKYHINAKAILLTPLVQTFDSPAQDCTAFHGTSDPWAATADIKRLCAEHNVPLHIYENANHSLETKQPKIDISILSDVISKLSEELN